jgi:hypothetical protein
MTLKHIAPILIITVLLVACGGGGASPTAVATEKTSATQTTPAISYPAPGEQTPVLPTAPYPAPGEETPVPDNPYPAPGTPGGGTSSVPPSGYEPQPGDKNLTRDSVLLNMEDSQVVINSESPIQVSVQLSGSLSDPCHQLRVVVSLANANHEINLEVYSVYDSSLMCITVIKPFSVNIPLGTYPSGHYTVFVNGELLGEFSS